MVPKYMSNIPSNPFSSNPFSTRSNTSGLVPMSQQIQEVPRSRTGSRPANGLNAIQTKRFSLNPLGFLGANGDMLDRNRNMRGRAQGDENFENSLDQKGEYKPSANMSVGGYGQEYSERRMY